MDNICHTLVGAALAQSGLKRRTGLGAATLMIGANFPDIDVVAVPLGRAIDFRRGWTHGVLALVVLPFVLTALMIAWDRWRRRSSSRPRADVVPRQVLLLSVVSILTHPTLDWMNSYGLRWLMPFDGRWFYGDSLFIVDPWLLLVLGGGVWLARRRERAQAASPVRRRERAHAAHPETPARIALGVAAAYVVAMLALHRRAEHVARRDLAAGGRTPAALWVTPSPANPLTWRVMLDDGASYWRGTVGVLGLLDVTDERIPKNADDPAALAAARTIAGRRFLDWARMPHFVVERGGGAGARVTIADARYGASVQVLVE
jgi:inner membrane protein